MEPVRKRGRYTARACVHCKQRKVKCSGEDTCVQCRLRGDHCMYMPHSRAAAPAQRRNRVLARSQPDKTQNSASMPTDQHTSWRPITTSNSSEFRTSMRDNSTTRSEDLPPPLPTPTNDDDPPPTQADEAETEEPRNNLDHEATNGYCSTFEGTGFAARLSAMSLLLEDAKTSPSFISTRNRPSTIIRVTLVAEPQIRSLLDVFFAEMEWTLPMMDRSHIMERLPGLLVESSHSESGQLEINTSVDNYPMGALLCVMLATAELLSSDSTSTKQARIPGQKWYVKTQDLLQHFREQDQTEVDLVRCHTLRSYYLLAVGKSHMASEAIGVAIRLAAASDLNIGDAQHSRSHSLRRHCTRLWWSICVMDQQICRIAGTPYWLHDGIITSNDNSAPSSLHDADIRDSSDAGLILLQALVLLANIEKRIWDYQLSSRSGHISDRRIAATIKLSILVS